MISLIQLMKREGYGSDEQIMLLIASLKEAVEATEKDPNIEMNTRGLAEEVLKAIPVCSNCDVIDALQVVKNVAIGWNMWTIYDVESRMETLDYPVESLSAEQKKRILKSSANSVGTADTFDEICDSLIESEIRTGVDLYEEPLYGS